MSEKISLDSSDISCKYPHFPQIYPDTKIEYQRKKVCTFLIH